MARTCAKQVVVGVHYRIRFDFGHLSQEVAYYSSHELILQAHMVELAEDGAPVVNAVVPQVATNCTYLATNSIYLNSCLPASCSHKLYLPASCSHKLYLPASPFRYTHIMSA